MKPRSPRPGPKDPTRAQPPRSPLSRPPSYAKPQSPLAKAQQTYGFLLWGKHPITAYLSRLDRAGTGKGSALHVLAAKPGEPAGAGLADIVEMARAKGCAVTEHPFQSPNWPLAADEGITHQRVALELPEFPRSHIEDILASYGPEGVPQDVRGCIGLALDGIVDPRNFGAILRSAAFFGVEFAIFGQDRQAQVTPLVAKTSSGGAFALRLAPVVNLNRALDQLKNRGFWIVGAALDARSLPLAQLPCDRPYVLVLGNEHKGLRQEVAKRCDYLVAIPGGAGSVESLNVSVATGVCLHWMNGAGLADGGGGEA